MGLVTRHRAPALALLGALAIAGAAALVVRQNQASAAPTAILTVYTGSATIIHAGAQRGGHTGDLLGDGDGVATSSDGRASVSFPGGSEVRLDVSTGITQINLRPAGGGGLEVTLVQASGSTFNSVAALLGTSRYRVRGPNGSTAEVRGTDFVVTVGVDDRGRPADEVDVLVGAVEVRSAGASALVAAGQATRAARNQAPEPPRPIADDVKRSSFVVFNQAVSAARGTRPLATGVSTLSQGESSAPATVSTPGGADLSFTLSWPGSTFRLTVVDPAGTVYRTVDSPASPIVIVVTQAAGGTWRYVVTDVESAPEEPYATAVGRGSPAPAPSPPVFNPAACDGSGRPGDTVSIGIHAVPGAGGGLPLLSLDGAPAGVTLTAAADSGTVRVAIPADRSPGEIDFHVVATTGADRASLLCRVVVVGAHASPTTANRSTATSDPAAGGSPATGSGGGRPSHPSPGPSSNPDGPSTPGPDPSRGPDQHPSPRAPDSSGTPGGPLDQPPGPPAGRPPDPLADPSPGRPIDRPTDRPVDRPTDRPVDQPTDVPPVPDPGGRPPVGPPVSVPPGPGGPPRPPSVAPPTPEPPVLPTRHPDPHGSATPRH